MLAPERVLVLAPVTITTLSGSMQLLQVPVSLFPGACSCCRAYCWPSLTCSGQVFVSFAGPSQTQASVDMAALARPSKCQRTSTRIRVASTCSGWCSELHALQLLGLLGRVQPVFAAESDAAARRLCQHLWHHDRMYHDCTDDEFLNHPQRDIDFFTSGPPCQPFSVQGLRRGCRDQRAAPLLATILWIAANLPVCWLLESVAGLVHEHGEFFVQILDMFASFKDKNGKAAYDVSWKSGSCWTTSHTAGSRRGGAGCSWPVCARTRDEDR